MENTYKIVIAKVAKASTTINLGSKHSQTISNTDIAAT